MEIDKGRSIGKAGLTHPNFVNAAARYSGAACRSGVFDGFWRADPKPLKRLNTLAPDFPTGLKPGVNGTTEMILDAPAVRLGKAVSFKIVGRISLCNDECGFGSFGIIEL
jgi:hypothetical protein